jgi:hypothetical protein
VEHSADAQVSKESPALAMSHKQLMGGVLEGNIELLLNVHGDLETATYKTAQPTHKKKRTKANWNEPKRISEFVSSGSVTGFLVIWHCRVTHTRQIKAYRRADIHTRGDRDVETAAPDDDP